MFGISIFDDTIGYRFLYPSHRNVNRDERGAAGRCVPDKESIDHIRTDLAEGGAQSDAPICRRSPEGGQI